MVKATTEIQLFAECILSGTRQNFTVDNDDVYRALGKKILDTRQNSCFR